MIITWLKIKMAANLLQTNSEKVCRWNQKGGQEEVISSSSLPLCIQQAILDDEYGNGPHSSGTISFQRARSGSAVRFD